jgi:hypothetical protein
MLWVRKNTSGDMAELDFLERLEELLCLNLTEESVKTHDLRRIAEHCVETARSYGLVTERAIAAFMLHMITIHPEFHKQPKIRAILSDSAAPESVRMERLLSEPTDAEWEEATPPGDQRVYWAPFRLNSTQTFAHPSLLPATR